MSVPAPGSSPVDKYTERRMESVVKSLGTTVSHDPIAIPKMTGQDALKQASLEDIEREVRRLQKERPFAENVVRGVPELVNVSLSIMNTVFGSWFNHPIPLLPTSKELDDKEVELVKKTFKDCKTDEAQALRAVAYLQLLKGAHTVSKSDKI